MDIKAGNYYIDNEENIYKCISTYGSERYSEAVMHLQGDLNGQTNYFFVFYRNLYAWVDRECPDFKLMDEVLYYPHVVNKN